jgi:hypothetical protein
MNFIMEEDQMTASARPSPIPDSYRRISPTWPAQRISAPLN